MSILRKLTSILLCIAMLAMLYIPASAAGTETNLSISADAGRIDIGDTFQVTLSVGGMTVSSIAGGIIFDTMLLECVSIEGTRSGRPERVYLQDNYEDWNQAAAASTVDEANSSGRVGFAWTGTQDTVYPAQNFAIVTFRAIAIGGTDIFLYEDSAGADGKKYDAVVGSGENTVHIDVVPITYAVTFDANGGSGAPEAQTKTPGEALTLSSGVPLRDGFTFLGWSESKTATAAQYQPGGSFTEDADTMLYAVWLENEKLVITVQPVSFTGAEGDEFTFSLTAQGKEITYQWQSLEGDTWADCILDGNQTDTLTGQIGEADDGRRFRCRLIDAYAAELLSEEVTLNVTASGTVAFGTCGENLTWVLDQNGVLTITGTGRMEDYDTGSAPWYVLRSQIQEVVISEGATTVGQSAFQNCTQLAAVTIPNGVTTIVKNGFNGCTALESVHLPAGFRNVGEGAFQGCTSLAAIDVPSSVTSFGKSAFMGCSSLSGISIPAGIRTLEQYVFYGCSSLTGVVIPENVRGIGQGAFYQCSSLTSITIPEAADSIGSHVFYGCSSLSTVHLPESMGSIRSYMFGACTSLVSITLPDRLKTVSSCAFLGCTSLREIVLPEGTTSIYSSAFQDCTALESIVIPDSVTTISQYAFRNCTCLANIDLPSGLTTLGIGAFSGCTGLNEVSIPAGITFIDQGTFADCTGLTSVTVPNTVTEIRSRVFINCSGLESVTLPASVLMVDQYAFNGCSKLSDVYYGGTESQWAAIDIRNYNSELLNAEIHSTQEVTISFDANGGTGTMAPIGIGQGGTLVLPDCGFTAPACHEFAGWDKGAAGETITVTESMVVTAQWQQAAHSLTLVPAKEATCTEEGSIAYYVCEACGKWYADEAGTEEITDHESVKIAAGNHSLTLVPAKEATATESGNLEYYICTYCGNWFWDNEGRALIINHDSVVLAALTLKLSSNTPSVLSTRTGSEIIWTASATGGSGVLQYRFQLYKDGSMVEQGGFTPENTYSYTPTSPGSYMTLVYVRDSEGNRVNMMSDNVEVVAISNTPGSILSVSAATSAGRITVTWTASEGATAYIIQRRVKDSDTWTTLKSNVTGLSYEDTTGEAGTVYQYRVRGRNGTVYGSFKVSSVVRFQAGETITTPGAISSVTAKAEAGKITVTWTASANATAYIIQRRVQGADTWTTLKSNVAGLSYEDTTGEAGVVYQYRVRGRNGTVYGPFKTGSVVRAQAGSAASAAPGAISSVTAKAEAGKVTVSWTASQNATAYIIQRRVKDGDTWTTLKSNVAGLSYEDTTGEAGTVYQYRVRGRDGTSYGPFKVSSVVRAQAAK